MTNFTLPEKPIYTVAATRANEITKEYYNMLIGPISNGEIYKAVCRVEDKRFYNCVSYHLISL
jgi:hypothetical protein